MWPCETPLESVREGTGRGEDRHAVAMASARPSKQARRDPLIYTVTVRLDGKAKTLEVTSRELRTQLEAWLRSKLSGIPGSGPLQDTLKVSEPLGIQRQSAHLIV